MVGLFSTLPDKVGLTVLVKVFRTKILKNRLATKWGMVCSQKISNWGGAGGGKESQ